MRPAPGKVAQSRTPPMTKAGRPRRVRRPNGSVSPPRQQVTLRLALRAAGDRSAPGVAAARRPLDDHAGMPTTKPRIMARSEGADPDQLGSRHEVMPTTGPMILNSRHT